MAALSHSESRRLYSWWWDSHISPKNSKWLQENLTDMDQKVKGMIKLLEQDGDSFARKAEMYFKNRPELLKLVEEFYRAYRALAERYDHATGALRQAHKTMAEVFPDQDDLDEDSPLGSSETDPHTPETLHPLRAKLDPDDLHKDAIGISSPRFKLPKKGGASSNEIDSLTGTKGLKQLNDLFGSGEGALRYVKFGDGRMRKGLNYREEDRSDNMTENGQSLQFGISKQNRRPPLKSEQASKVENEVQTLKNSLAKVEAEKDAGFLQYQHALERLSELEAKVSRAQEDSRECSERSSRAEAEVQALHEALTRLQKEKEDGLLQYHQCAEMMSNLENKMSHSHKDSQFNAQDIKSESDPESLKQALARVKAERDASLIQYSQSLEKISKLESQVSLAEENARNLNERAVRAENEVQLLKEAIVKAGEEKESALLQYQRSLETISVLQTEVSHAHEEVRRLSNVLVMGVAQLNSTEEQYLQLQKENLSLQTEVDNLLEMMEIQKQELSEKNEEIERLQIDIEEEYVRSMEAEEALQSLQDVHSECPEEHRAFVLDSQHSDERLIDMELEHQVFAKIEAWSPKEGHKTLNERRSLSPGLAETNLQDEIIRLREAGAELDKEVEVLVDQKNELQQEIHTLKEEINDLKTRHLIIVGQLEQVGLEPDCLGSSVKSLQDENSRLADICEKDRAEKISLWEKLKDMENILEKNALLENSLSEVNAAVELLREKVKELEDICQLLKRVNSGIVAEKEFLISQLAIANGKAEKLSEKNTHLQNFLYDASVERDWLREKSNSLEGICQSLTHEKLELVTVNNNVVSEFKSIQQKLHDLSRKYTDLEVKSSDLEKERESTAHQVKELQSNLALVRQEYSSFMSSSEAQLAHLEEKNHILQEESKRVMIKFEDEQDKAVLIQLEIFILQRCIKEMEERNRSLFMEYQKQLETSNLSEHRARSLELENFEQQVKANSLFDEVQTLRSGIHQMASSLKVNQAHKCQAEIENDNLLLQLSLRKVEDLETSLWLTQDEKHQLLFENSVLLTLFSQLRLTAAGIKSDSIALDRDLKLRTEDLLLLQSEQNILKSESDHLNQQFGVWEETLSRKGTELIETERNLKATKTENAELYRKLENTNRECDEARLRISVLELHNLRIGETNLHQHEEINRLHKVIEMLELEMGKLHKEIQEGRVREDFLSSEVQQIKSKLKLWEHEAEALYSNWQIADTHAVLFEQKLRELAGVCVSVEDERILNVQSIAQMKERVRVLELENKGTKSDLAAYLPAVASLNDSVTLLEDHVFSATEEQADNHEIEAANSSSNLQDNTNKERSGDQSLMVVDGVSNLLALQTRIKKIENSVIEQKKLQMKENFDRNIKLDAAIREIQKFEQSGRTLHNTDPESSVKDIPLDQVSHSSSYDRHTMSKRQDFNRSSEILEIWETEEKDFELDLTFEQKSEPVALEGNSEYCSSDIQSEDWSSKSMTIPMSGGGKKKILERLASDAQKLMNLLLAVQDLKKTAQGLEKFKTPKNDIELDRVKAEIDELEEAIMQLSGTNDKLSKRAETNYELEETEKARKNRVSERARRSSEKIGRLQIEVQRIQFVLARLDNKYKGKDRKVLLKDYLYGNLRSPLNMKQRKKPQLFSCVKLKPKW